MIVVVKYLAWENIYVPSVAVAAAVPRCEPALYLEKGQGILLVSKFGLSLCRGHFLMALLGDYLWRSVNSKFLVKTGQFLFHAFDRLVEHNLGSDL